ncbi:family 61 glycoside hydrolase [Serpula lacrymans var. lacrymans S7.9]|uniref:lytic cellulose monooxygenase (C4-dehydrogenating) n=1 Tax=Serpula lacrymans var. lacrymans (strain S7.9) TaxID=578457 RepID=F8PCC0_SERL9|nr:family 61 glycoside hydrolase [Serpula lacrymans var. lacrymans S7.9]EGO19398.1 family 61 glycoside hydrolase [Serpula lacrymans var. lacrymans S7.9]
MKSITLLSIAAVLLPSVSAHYRWTSLVVGSTITTAYEYVRQNTNDNSPVTDVTSTDLRCNVGGLASGATTSTYTVSAGSVVGLALDQAIYHPGVVNIYMAKAPANVSAWDGSGAVWFKVHEVTAITNGGTSISWPSVGMSQVTFTLPASIPDGQYFVRAEDIALHVAESYGGAQFYLSCAQINVQNGGNGTPGPLVSIPGVYTGYEPGILINIYSPIPANYTQPGPAVWTG